MITREHLRAELARYPTREELHEVLRTELAAYPTREELRKELRAELAGFATKEDLAELREETASGFADLRRYMEILYEDLKGTMRTVLETLVARMDGRDITVDQRLDDHERRISAVEGRVIRLEHKPSH